MSFLLKVVEGFCFGVGFILAAWLFKAIFHVAVF
jgi:hypothetical protein